jgi:hypothetical protein
LIGDGKTVNGTEVAVARATPAIPKSRPFQKKAGLEEPGLRYWPREADTITFQEGLLSVRATGGGGQLRNTKSQLADTMIRVGASQQPSMSHVSHAETGGF